MGRGGFLCGRVPDIDNVSSNPPFALLVTRSTPRLSSSFTFAALAARSRQSMIDCDASLTGNMRPSLSVFSFTPRDSNHATVSIVWKVLNGANNARSPRGNRVINSRASKQACVTLQRPPPEMRTLERNCGLFSTTVTFASGAVSAHVMAAKNPAAPPPTTMTRRELIRANLNRPAHHAPINAQGCAVGGASQGRTGVGHHGSHLVGRRKALEQRSGPHAAEKFLLELRRCLPGVGRQSADEFRHALGSGRAGQHGIHGHACPFREPRD